MAAIKLADNLWSVGVLNPNMRIFDIVMRTEYGTSYNAYLVKGSEKTALIDTNHGEFFDEFIENIKEVIDPATIDYIIFNHTEPDHSGALAELLKLAPHAVVYGSATAGGFLKEIANCDFPFEKATDQMTLDLGGRTLKFISAPFLHWPDSMFTEIEGEGIIFTCDFFGAHFCETRMLDTYLKSVDKYEVELENYYQAIFGPFAPHVQSGLAKADWQKMQLVCPSHGPILTQRMMPYVQKKYAEWSAPHKNAVTTIPIFYVSAYGCTRRAAEAIREGILEGHAGWNVSLYDLNEYDMGEMAQKLVTSDAFLVGTPTINRDMLAPVTTLLAHTDPYRNKGKKCAVFGSYGWSGEGVPNAYARMKTLGFEVQEETFRFRFVPSEQNLQDATAFGKAFAATL